VEWGYDDRKALSQRTFFFFFFFFWFFFFIFSFSFFIIFIILKAMTCQPLLYIKGRQLDQI